MLEIDVRPIRGILFVRLSGILNKKNIDKLTEVIHFQKEVGIKNIVFNINELQDMDRAGKGALISSFNLCKKSNGQSFICLSDNVNLLNKLKGSVMSSDFVTDELAAVNLINS